MNKPSCKPEVKVMLAMCHTKSLFGGWNCTRSPLLARVEDVFARVSNSFKFSGFCLIKSYVGYATSHSNTTDCHVLWVTSNVRYMGNMLKAITQWIITLLPFATAVFLVSRHALV